MLTFCSLCGCAAWAAVYATSRDVMPGDAFLLSCILSAVIFYLASSLPRRIEGAAALAQSREAAVLAVMGSTALEATRSRTKATLLLRSSEGAVCSALREVRRNILLGVPASVAVAQSSGLASRAVREVLRSVSSPGTAVIVEEGEEANAIARSSQLGDETKSPLFMTVAFFAPLMLLLYALMAHVTGLTGLSELVLLQVILLDVAFYFSSADAVRRP